MMKIQLESLIGEYQWFFGFVVILMSGVRAAIIAS